MFLLLHGFLLTSSPSLFTLNWKSAFSLQSSFGGKSSWARIWSHLLCLCVICMGNCSWFTDSKLWFTDDELTHQCALVIGGEVYVTWKRKMLHDVVGGYQAYIQRKKDLFVYLWSLEFCSWLRPRAVSRLRALRARPDYKVTTLGTSFTTRQYSRKKKTFVQNDNKEVSKRWCTLCGIMTSSRSNQPYRIFKLPFSRGSSCSAVGRNERVIPL